MASPGARNPSPIYICLSFHLFVIRIPLIAERTEEHTWTEVMTDTWATVKPNGFNQAFFFFFLLELCIAKSGTQVVQKCYLYTKYGSTAVFSSTPQQESHEQA